MAPVAVAVLKAATAAKATMSLRIIAFLLDCRNAVAERAPPHARNHERSRLNGE
jgi:hypothetical protein